MSAEQHQGEMILLGTGTSVGVPVLGCDCPVCTSSDPRNARTRTGVAVHAPAGTFVIDTSPELRLQLLREQIPLVRAAVFTHAHADHIFGLDDLRICGHRMDAAVPLYCEAAVEESLRRSFHYAFAPTGANTHKFAVPRFEFQRIGLDPFDVLGITLRPIRLYHGPLPVLGFRINDVAFCTDVSHIPDESWPLIENLDALVLGALRDEPHPTHFSVKEALDVIRRVRPQRAWLTHLGHSLDYSETNTRLPENVNLAHDGLRIRF